MTISEEQLQTWSTRGAIQTAEGTNIEISRALDSVRGVRYKGLDKRYEVYLQGSYKNHTNIRADSDVDVVVELKTTFGYNLDELLETEKVRFHRAFPSNATYQLEDFREDILFALCSYFGARNVTEGNKAIRIAPAPGRLPADVVVCLEYRKYSHFLEDTKRYVPGIRFYTQNEHREVINYPTPHYDNGVAKNKATSERFKPTVRMFKNARNYLEAHGMLGADVAPSYFLQCFLYNSLDSAFRSNLQDTYFAVIRNLVDSLSNGSADSFMCQNGQVPLFGDTPEQWSQSKAITLITALLELWEKGT